MIYKLAKTRYRRTLDQEDMVYITDKMNHIIDASSAFDRVHYGKLFDVLMKRNMPAVCIRLLLDGYLNQRICEDGVLVSQISSKPLTALNRAV